MEGKLSYLPGFDFTGKKYNNIALVTQIAAKLHKNYKLELNEHLKFYSF